MLQERVNVRALGQFIATNSYGFQVLTDCSLQGAEIADVIKTWHSQQQMPARCFQADTAGLKGSHIRCTGNRGAVLPCGR
jgi:hypothetical protein